VTTGLKDLRTQGLKDQETQTRKDSETQGLKDLTGCGKIIFSFLLKTRGRKD